MRAGRWTAAKTPEWEPHELEGRTIGLVGMGRIGREVARRLRPFDVQLQYYDVVPAPTEVTDSLQVQYVSWSELLETLGHRLAARTSDGEHTRTDRCCRAGPNEVGRDPDQYGAGWADR